MKTVLNDRRSAVSSSRRAFLKFTASAAIGGGLTLGMVLPVRGEIRFESLTAEPQELTGAFRGPDVAA